MIENVAAECRMPLCYGGGIHSVAQAVDIFSLGVEKVSLSAAAVARPALVKEIATEVGSQSVVVVVDIRRNRFGGGYEVYTYNGARGTRRSPADVVAELQDFGVGEIVLNSIDRDGTMSGFDFDLVDLIGAVISVPYTILGGAGSIQHLRDAVARYGVLGIAAGSLFVFKGPFRAVLINYPDMKERRSIAELAHCRLKS
jgi:cyclase